MSLLNNLNRNKIAAIVGAAVAVLAALGFLVYSMSRPTMVPLYGELSQDDASLVVAKLQAMNKQYITDKNGQVIMVAAYDVLPLRMQLAQEGIPSDSKILGYELFDNQDIIGSSQFVNNINEIRALEGELVRTINSLAAIEQSRVHIVMPKSDYFTKSGQQSSASVFVKVKGGKKLTEAQIAGIANLVAAAVPRLSIDNVAIIDQNGKALKTPGDEEQSSSSKNIAEYKTNIENKLKLAIEDLVGKHVGVGKVQANVVAEIDFDKIIVNQEEYDPNSAVVRSQRSTSEKSTDTEMDKNVSVSTNIPSFLQKPQPTSFKESSRDDGITNYEISKTVTNKVIQWGSIKNLSVAVLVDGVYEKDKSSLKQVYVRDRTAEELSKVKQLVMAAIGVDESRGDRVEVMNLPFATNDMFDSPQEPGFKQYDAATLAQLIIILVIIVLAALLFVKPNFKKIFAKDKMSSDEIPESLQNKLASSENEKVDKGTAANRPFAERQYEELLNYFNSSAVSNMDDTIKVIRNWIFQGKQ